MSRISTQRKKTVILAASIAIWQTPATLLIEHFHSSRFLPVVVSCWAIGMAAMLVYVMKNMIELKRLQRGAR